MANPFESPTAAPPKRRTPRLFARGTQARRWRFKTGLLLGVVSFGLMLALQITIHFFARTPPPVLLFLIEDGNLLLVPIIAFLAFLVGLFYTGLFLWLTSFPRHSRKWRRNCLWTRALLPDRFRRPRLADRRRI